MKKKLILLPIAGMLCYVLSSYSSGPGTSVGDRTGATPATSGCSVSGGCHAPSATTSTGVTLELYDATGTTLVTTGYVGGTAYKIRLKGVNTSTTVTNLKKFGFQVSAVKTSSTSTNEGTLAAVAGCHLGTYGGISIVEHSSALTPATGTGGTGTTYVVPDIPWTAPATGTGSVTVFAVLNAVNGDGGDDAGDKWNTTTLVLPEATSSVAPITGTMTVCVAATTALTDATAGGTWSSSATAIATVNSTGLVTGVAPGTATITYNAGASGNATTTVTVSTATPAALTGANIVCVGTHIYMSDATAGGVWSSSATTIATAGTSGTITGVAVGTATISYTVTNSCGTASATKTVTVKAAGGSCVSGIEPTTTITSTSLKVYPNPSRGAFAINVESADNTPAHVIITSITGAVVKEYDTTTNKSVEVTINNPAGIYFLSARTISGVYVSKILTQ